MNNSDMPATACTIQPSIESIHQAQGLNVPVPTRTVYTGLTKREAFAMAAMQGLAGFEHIAVELIASQSVMLADALLKELEK